MIDHIRIKNFKIFQSLTLSLNNDINIIVGNNEAGKSTIIEAIALALTKRINGKAIEYEVTSHLFNKQCVGRYLKDVAEGKNPPTPEIAIELFLQDLPDLQRLRGTNNSQKTDCVGVKLVIAFDDEYADEYTKLLDKRAQIKTVPTEYYKVNWYSFANNAITPRSLPVAVSNIDATTIRLQSGTDYFLQEIINGTLDAKEKVLLAIAYRKLKEQFSEEAAIVGINAKLTQKQGAIHHIRSSCVLRRRCRIGWNSPR